MAILCTGNGRGEKLTHIATSTTAYKLYNLLLEHNATGESITTIHKTTAIEFSEYDLDTGRVSFQDKIENKDIGPKSQEATVEGLLDLSVLNKAPEIHSGAMTGIQYYGSKNEDISRGSMNTQAWHDTIMGPKGGLRARATIQRGNSNVVPEGGSSITTDGDRSSNTEDATTEEEALHQAAYQAGDGWGARRIDIRQHLPSAQEDRVGGEHNHWYRYFKEQ